MGYRIVMLAGALFALAVTQVGHAQQPGKVYRIAYLQGSANLDTLRVKAFRRGLREHGFVEGQNIVIEWRHTNRRRDVFPEKVKELAKLGLDCIVTVGVAATRAAKDHAPGVPVVMADADGDPVRYGLIESFARPGGHVTGVTSFASGLSGKRLELLKETFPRLSRVAVLVKDRAEGALAHVPLLEKAARELGLAFLPIKIRGGEDVGKAFDAAAKWKADALVVVTAGGMRGHRERVIRLAAERRVPVMYTGTTWVRRGGLMGYQANVPRIRWRAAGFVAKILKGARPADLPVERPTKFDLMINLKAAKAIGVTFPPAILYGANKVID